MSNQSPDYSNTLGDTDGDIPTTEKKALCIYRYPRIAGDVDGDTDQLTISGPPMSEERRKEYRKKVFDTINELAHYYREDYVDGLIDEEFPSES